MKGRLMIEEGDERRRKAREGREGEETYVQ
jgi:hypothetical protein